MQTCGCDDTMRNSVPKNILVIRNDKLGDFMLAYPAFALLKKSLPACKVTALVPAYTKPVAEICQWIDDVIVEEPHQTLSEHKTLAKKLASYNFDAVIVLFSTMSTAITTRLAKIPYRLAPATKWAQFLYNHRLKQRRSKSEKPEYEYNMDLVRYFLSQHDVTIQNVEPPYLCFEDTEIQQLKHKFIKEHNISENDLLIFVHPGSGGSAKNLSLDQYAGLINNVQSDTGHHIVLTAGPGEEDLAKKLQEKLHISSTVFCSSKGLVDFIKHQAFCDCFISGSTGTLHTAGALNRKTVAFYPRKRSSTPLRWQTCNEDSNRISFIPEAPAEETDMRSIDTQIVADKVSGFLRE